MPIGKVNKYESKKRRTKKIFLKIEKKKENENERPYEHFFLYWLLVFELWIDLLCVFFFHIWIVIIVATVILLVKSTWGRVLH